MGFLRLLINGISFHRAIENGSIDKRFWWLFDSFRDRALLGGQDVFFEGLCSLVFYEVKSKKDFINKLEKIKNEDKISNELYGWIIDLFANVAENKFINGHISDRKRSDFDFVFDDLEDDYSVKRFFEHNASYDFEISKGIDIKLSKYEREWLESARTEEIIISDMYIFDNFEKEKINSEEDLSKFILKYTHRLKKFFLLRYIKRMLILFNSSKIGGIITEDFVEKFEMAKRDYDDDVFSGLEFLLINLNEKGRNREEKEEKVKGVFHRRQLMTTTFRVLFDTKADISSNRNNSFEMHPLYYDHETTRKTERNQFRAVYLAHFIYHLKMVIPKNDKRVNGFLESMESFNRFEEAYGNSNVLRNKYRTTLNFNRVKVSLLEN